jgi:hypothetical protein
VRKKRDVKKSDKLTFWRSSRTLRTYRVSRTAALGQKDPKGSFLLAHPIRMDTISHSCAASANNKTTNRVP